MAQRYRICTYGMSKKYKPRYQKLIKRLRAARLDAGLTQETVGDKLKKPQSYVSKIERGERNVDIIEMADIAKLYKKPIEYFVK